MLYRPIVSICIPTYNRSVYLKNCIESIVCQSEFDTNEIELVISDNASTDDTSEMVREYTSKFNNVFYYCNDENIRDRNFPIAIGHASGSLRRLCNDSLIFSAGSVRNLIETAKKYYNNRAFLFFYNEKINREKSDVIEISKCESFFYKLSYHATWIGGFSIWEDECVNINDDTECCDLQLWQLRKLCEILSKNNLAAIIHESGTKIQTVKNKDISYGLYRVFYENYFYILKHYVRPSLSDKCIEWLEKDILYNFFTYWLIQCELNKNNLKISDADEIRNELLKQYKGKVYFKEYVMHYKYQRFKEIVKRMLIEYKK